VFILGDIAGGLQEEAQTGTLEQLFLSPYSAPRIFITRAIANLTLQLILNLSILLLIVVMTGSNLSFPPKLLLPLLTVLLGAYGLALALGSLALLLKRVQQMLGIFQFLLLFMLLVPVETWSGSTRFLGWLLPMTPGAGLLREVMARGQPLELLLLLAALLNGVAYFALGLFLFHLAEQEAKRRGKLGEY
jgi:ABC-2 type transport system permease protein